MKLSGLFKKEKKTKSASVQPLEKNQLKNVIGGTDTLVTSPIEDTPKTADSIKAGQYAVSNFR
jgi:hypothetical protein